MGPAISEVLPYAVGVAIVPIPVIAVILMLFSQRARVNGPAFVLGWVVGISAAFALVVVLAEAGDVGSDETASDSVSWLTIALGVLLLVLAWRSWRTRPAPGSEPALPGWMSRVDSMSPVAALGLGLALAVNPKNLVFIVGAGTGVVRLGSDTADEVAAGVAFVVVASLSVATPVAYSLVGGENARGSLDALKGWLELHNKALVSAVLVILGVVFISRGLPPLTD